MPNLAGAHAWEIKCQAQTAARAALSSTVRRAVRTGFTLLSLTVTLSCFADERAFNLMEIAHIGGKGRIQDQNYHSNDRQVTAILAMGKDAIPLLIETLDSERPYDNAP